MFIFHWSKFGKRKKKEEKLAYFWLSSENRDWEISSVFPGGLREKLQGIPESFQKHKEKAGEKKGSE